MSEEELALKIMSKVDHAGFKQAEVDTLAIGKAAETSGSKFSGLGKAMTVGLAAGAVAIGGAVAVSMKLVDAAEAQADAQARVSLSFGAAAAEVNAAAASQANALGMSKTAYLDATGALGAYTKSLGVQKDTAADMSIGLANLAPKLAAYTGAEQEAVNGAFEKALAGKTKGLEALGVHIGAIPKGLNAAQQAEFVYGQIVKKTGDAEKAWVDNRGDVENSSARIKASFDDLKATLGDKLLPIIAPVAEKVADLVDAFSTGGIDAFAQKLEDMTGIDFSGYLDTARQAIDDVKAALLPALTDALKEAGSFLKDKVIPAVQDLVGWLGKNEDAVLFVVVALAAFKTALAIQSLIQGVGKALTDMQIAWQLYTAGASEAALETLGLDIALSPVTLVLLAIALAVGLLAVAWKNDWGHIREHAEGVVIWVQNIPKYFTQTWEDIKTALAEFFGGWKKVWQDLKTDPLKGFAELLLEIGAIPAKMAKLGWDIIAGLLGGLKRAWDGLMHWWRGKGNNLAAQMKSEIKSESPSRVFADIGRDIILGLALGLDKNAHTAAEAMDKAIGGLLDEQRINDARARVDTLVRRIWAARDAFLTGGAAEKGSLAWLVKEWGDQAPKFADVFAKLNIPVSDLAGFVTLMDRLQMEDPELATATWNRFWEEMKTQQNAVHEARLKGLDDEAKRQAEIIDVEKRHFQWVQDQEAQSAAKGGNAVGQKTEFFSDDKARVAAALQPILTMLGDKNLADFWKRWNDDENANINTTEDLNKAIDAVMTATAKYYSDKRDAENANHEAIMANLEAQAAFLQTLIDDHATAEQDLADLIALRQELLDRAAEAIKANQAAEEEFENRKHEQIVGFIEAERQARKTAHDQQMTSLKLIRDEEVKRHKAIVDGLAAEKAVEDAVHNARVKALTDEKTAIDDSFKEQERNINHLKVSLAQLALDLDVEGQMTLLAELGERLQKLKDVAASFKIDPTGRGQLEMRRSAQVDRVRATTDEQQAAIRDAIASGKLSEAQMKQANFALLGHRVRAKDIADIMAVVAKQAEDDVKAQQAIVDANAAKIKAAQDEIALAEQKLAMDRDGAAQRLADIEAELKAETARNEAALKALDDRAKAEDARSSAELARIDGLIAAETSLFDAQMAFLDSMAKAEDQRHAQRMSDIAAEAAYRLATLGMTPEEIEAFVKAAQEMAAKIAAEAKAEFDRAIGNMPGAGGGTGSGGDTPGGGGGTPPPSDRPITLTGETVAKEVKVESAVFTANLRTSAVLRLPSGREIALETVDALLDDVALLDKLGKKLNERKVTTP